MIRVECNQFLPKNVPFVYQKIRYDSLPYRNTESTAEIDERRGQNVSTDRVHEQWTSSASSSHSVHSKGLFAGLVLK